MFTMKLVFKTYYKNFGGNYLAPAEIRECGYDGDPAEVLTILGYKKLDSGKWFKRTAWNECETCEVK